MHCLPRVQALKISFVGPEACCVLDQENFPMREMECCPTCKLGKRKRFVAMHGLAYHDYYNEYLENPTDEESLKPDLIVAFNTGMHECDVTSWKSSLEVVLDLNVPALFTSFNRSEADQDYEVLKGVNAKMLHKDGPKRNPFAEMMPNIDSADNGEDNAIDCFFHKSMYCIAFKGRTE
jgi:splicing suppressor protein 51